MKIEIQTNLGKRYIGDYNSETKKFYKIVSESKHLFKKLDAWGIDGYYFEEVLLPNKAVIQIYDKESNFDYYIDATDFKKHGMYFHFKNNNEDNKAQIFCPRRNFAKLFRDY